jgi:branched-chain amino acid transport system substrate-binding protein
MRMHALTEVIKGDASAKRVYLIGQDYSFGQQLARSARAQLAAKRPDIAIVGDELHPIGKVKDFTPYVTKIKASGADTVITGNWGNDLTLLVKAAKESGLNVKFYTFYGNGLGAPAAIGDAGVGRVRAVAEWHPNTGQGIRNSASDEYYKTFRQRYPQPEDDYVHLRMHLMIEMLAAAIEKAGSTEASAVARALEGARYSNAFHEARMRAEDHQLLQPLYVSVMRKVADGSVRFDNEGSGYGFKTERYLPLAETALPTTCRMKRPD